MKVKITALQTLENNSMLCFMRNGIHTRNTYGTDPLGGGGTYVLSYCGGGGSPSGGKTQRCGAVQKFETPCSLFSFAGDSINT